MQIIIPKTEIKGVAGAPPSKSYTIRGLMCAALAKGHSELLNSLSSDDTEAAVEVLHHIGVKIRQRDGIWHIDRDEFKAPAEDLFCRESAATLRFMTAICSVIPGRCRLTAGPTLSKRPVRTLVEALRMWGAEVDCQGEFAPVTVTGGNLRGGLTELPGDISSQYISALLLAAPFCEKEATIRLTSPLESRAYVQMTIECLQVFGINITASEDLKEFRISPQKYQPAPYRVEGDWSSASYLLALGAISGKLSVSNLNPRSLQGDKAIVDLLRKMGTKVTISGEYINVEKGNLKALKADLNECIDLLPTLAAMAALAEGTSEFTGIRRARLKESNRVATMKEGLEKVGIRVIEEPDRLLITGGKPVKAVIDSKNDHRIAMAFSLLGVASGNITILGAECVSKTYPEYWEILRNLGVKLNER